MKIIETRVLNNEYVSREWNLEHTTKYVFELGEGKYIEAGYFIHFHDDEEVKRVVELPTSYGCPMKCKFCASSFIEGGQRLNYTEILEIFNYICEREKLDCIKPLFVSLTGIGDLHFTIDVAEKVVESISQERKDVLFTVSSCFWTTSLLKRVESMYEIAHFRAVQVTYLSSNQCILKRLMGWFEYSNSDRIDFDKIVRYISTSKIPQYRINYLMLKGINDSDESFDEFISLVLSIRDRIIVRISKLNVTKASFINGIQESTIEKMEQLKSALEEKVIKAYLFYSMKNDGMNCGQLLTEGTF